MDIDAGRIIAKTESWAFSPSMFWQMTINGIIEVSTGTTIKKRMMNVRSDLPRMLLLPPLTYASRAVEVLPVRRRAVVVVPVMDGVLYVSSACVQRRAEQRCVARRKRGASGERLLCE